MEKLVDDTLGILKESMKALSQEVVNNTLRLINAFSALILAFLPAKSSLEGIQGWELHPTPRRPRLPSWMENGVSSFNTFLQEYDSDNGSDNESEYASGLDDSNYSESSLFQAGHSQRRRGRSPIWKRSLRKLFSPFRVLTPGSKGPTKTKRPFKAAKSAAESVSGNDSAIARTSSSERFNRIYHLAKSHLSGVKDYVMPKQSGDRRRGVIEDVQLLMELAIERVFEVIRNIIYLSLSPLETLKLVLWWFFLSDPKPSGDEYVEGAAVLGNSDPALHKLLKRREGLNTDGRTCEDVITSLGYPYEAVRLTTADGHILLLERIPRPGSQKALYLQHGLLDSSLGWVSNGVVGSQAFAAYDQGYDVFLGNFRGLASREHVNRSISARSYWRYSVNEHGTQDIPTMLDKIHEIKMDDLKDIKDDVLSENPYTGERLPYALCGVAHSLGGASILMYVVTRRLEKMPHHLSRLILLSPAGFHEDVPVGAKIMRYIVPWIAPFVGPLVPGLYIPTRFCRALFNKLARDFQSYPAIGGLVQALLSLVIGGDSSNWVGAIGMSHYNMDDMPGVSFLVAQHLLQMVRAKRFVMFDFGSAQANMEAYGMPEPLDVGAHYEVIDIPVDVVAGVKDYVIPRSMVRRHFDTLKNAGCAASYDEFEYAHLDFTFSHREELLAYVMSRLLLVTPPPLKAGVRELVPPAPTSFKAKSFKHKLNTLLSRKLSRKLKLGLEDQCPQSSKQIEEDMSLTRYPNYDQDIVTAGSVSTDSHEESFRDPRSTSPSGIDPLQWMTPRQGLFVMARPQEPDMTRIRELKHQHEYVAAPIATKLKDDETVREHSSPKSNAFTKLASQLFRKNPSSNSTGHQISKPQRSISGMNICTLSNCYTGPTIIDEDSDE
ncbi:hypothetical protein KC19_12G163800 [Ceratodon purpureus]|uniref:Partial AB-hydrolase lipase domain-containing protein n=2 Tax=Ceratodon purpureus TaxID=3225 RepID=A0A8T0G8I2_CERPU|nr:hypothetical protein KC19_12G163800 [Ceratodon purpureus]